MPIDYKKYPVPRVRHHTNPAFYLPRTGHNEFLHYFPPEIAEVRWADCFNNAAPPDYLDIGCGMGKFTLEYSRTVPGKNILGLEVRRPVVHWVQGVIEGEKLNNCAALWYSVANGLPFIADASIGRIFYFFPDPWFKKRHRKRRAFTAEFLDECRRVLQADAALYLMTDVAEVDEYQREVLKQHGGFRICEVHSEQEWGLGVRSNQEEFCIKKDIPYTRLICTPRD